MIRLDSVSRRYGPLVALDGVSLEVRPAELVGLLGANGAGKSTLMRITAGLQNADSGRVELDGRDLENEPIAARARLGYMAEEPAFYEELSALEYLSFLAAIRGLDPPAAERRAHELLDRLGLASRASEPVERYSHGMRKKLSFAAAVLHEPRALLCDEAFEGLDLEASLFARDELRRLVSCGTAVLFSSHVAAELERLCDRIVLLHHGRCVRAIHREEWGGAAPGPSMLERAFLDVVRNPLVSETS
jgi:ABC-2 type transport system ATP-binding protein